MGKVIYYKKTKCFILSLAPTAFANIVEKSCKKYHLKVMKWFWKKLQNVIINLNSTISVF